jgi:glucose-6-phosphate isomerase
VPKVPYNQIFKNIDLEFVDDFLLKRAEILRNSLKNNEISAISTIFDEENVKNIEKIAQNIKKYQKVLVLGVGGSSLGGKTLVSLENQEKLRFLESIDTKTLSDEIAQIDFDNTFFLIISKSGQTIETVCQTLVILDKIGDKIKPENFLFVTENKDSLISEIAKKIGAKIFFHPFEIGGRFSCFSVVGLLPAFICNVDVEKILDGAKKTLNSFLQSDKNFVIDACKEQIRLYDEGYVNNVVMPYIDRLKNFTDWYRQLWAESLGKNNFGSTPINSMGTVDQHSQLQLYLDGPKNKFFTFFTLKNHKDDFLVKDLAGCKTLFGGKKLSEIVGVEQKTTIEILAQKELPIRVFEIENFDEEVLGALMMQMFLEVILIADCKNLNPFDQPAVELRKELAREMLSE